MRLLVSPALLERCSAAVDLLAHGRPFTGLPGAGVRALARRLSAAEVHYLRKALLGLGSSDRLRPRAAQDEEVIYLCAGHWLASGKDGGSGTALDPPRPGEGAQPGGGAHPRGEADWSLIPVADHVNLAWRSPLQGPNDESLGPRFPQVAGLYRPERLSAWLPDASPRIVRGEPQVGADLGHERNPSSYEQRLLERAGIHCYTSELAVVAIVAAHLGFHLAAALVIDERAPASDEREG